MGENYTLADYLFSYDEDGRILESEESDVLKILKKAGNELVNEKSGKIYPQSHFQLMAILALPDFPKSIEERNTVADFIERNYESTEIPPYFIDVCSQMTFSEMDYHDSYDLGGKILCSLGMFPETLRKRSTPVELLRNAGITLLDRVGYREVRDNFYNWEVFLSEYLGQN